MNKWLLFYFVCWALLPLQAQSLDVGSPAVLECNHKGHKYFIKVKIEQVLHAKSKVSFSHKNRKVYKWVSSAHLMLYESKAVYPINAAVLVGEKSLRWGKIAKRKGNSYYVCIRWKNKNRWQWLSREKILLPIKKDFVPTRGLKVIAKDPTGVQSEVELYHKSYAVVIGIDEYINLPHDLQLKYAVKDAQGVEKVLRSHFKFDKIYSLYNAQANKNKIQELLLGQLSRTTKEDGIFIFFCRAWLHRKDSFRRRIGLYYSL